MCLYDYVFEKHMELERTQSIKTLINSLYSLHHTYAERARQLNYSIT